MIRFLAASAVFISHFGSRNLSGGLFWQLEPLGTDAVVVFFVLSGFVISFVLRDHESDPLTYAVSRCARIYSVALPAIVLTIALDSIGSAINPAAYAHWPEFDPDHRLWQILNGLTFLNESWHHMQIGMNGPYWSLGYEVPYYAAFACAVFLRRPVSLIATSALMLAAGPRIAALFPMWLFGGFCYRIAAAEMLNERLAGALWLISSLLLALLLIPPAGHGSLFQPISFSEDCLQNYAFFYSLAFAFGLNLIGFAGIASSTGQLMAPFERPIRWCSGRTFSLYLFHMPIMQFLVAISPLNPAAWVSRLLLLTIVPGACFGLAGWSELRKSWWRRLFRRALPLVVDSINPGIGYRRAR